MSYYNRDQFLGAARQQYAWLRDRLAETEAQRQRHAQARAGLAQAQANALNALAAALFPTLSPQAEARAIDLAGFAAWRAQPPTAQYAQRKRELDGRRAAIEADPAFRDRATARPALHARLVQLGQQHASARAFLDRVDHPRLDRLMELGFGTPRYDVGFWRLSHHQDSAAAARILEMAGDGRSFPEVAAEVLRARQAVGSLDAQMATTRAGISHGEALDAEHARILGMLQMLPTEVLTAARKQVTDHVMSVAPPAMTRMLQRDPAVHRAYLEASGASHKIGYLDQLVARDVVGMQKKLAEEMARLQRDIAKFSRPKKWNAMFPVEKFQRRFRDRTPMFQKHWSRYDRSYRMIYDYDDYWRARAFEDFLWWDLMTRGRVDGAFIPHCAAWYAAHPGYRYVEPADDDMFDAAAAADAEDQEERRRSAGQHGAFRDAS